jgi:hypothetical protein
MSDYFIDFEFIDDGRTLDPISVGIVSSDDREFYACNTEARLDLASPWVRENVLPKLPNYCDPAWMPRSKIVAGIRQFMKSWDWYRDKPRIWAYFASYDWVALCQLLAGPMEALPEHFPKHVMCLKQLAVLKGNPAHHAPKPSGAHNALVDARWNRDLHRYLMALPWPEAK